MRIQFRLRNFIVSKACDYANLRCFTRSAVKLNKPDESAENWRQELHESMQIIPNFVSKEEEDALVKEIEPDIKRLPYEFAHWDDAIHGYRESERRIWNKENMVVINRIRERAFPKELMQLPLTHVLDLAPEGWIKPHVDSVRFCGEIIAGLSLLTDSVMRLRLVGDEEKYKEDFLLPRRSLYIMSGVARYKYQHEILKDQDSYFEGQHIPKTRRISVICRCAPDFEKQATH